MPDAWCIESIWYCLVQKNNEQSIQRGDPGKLTARHNCLRAENRKIIIKNIVPSLNRKTILKKKKTDYAYKLF